MGCLSAIGWQEELVAAVGRLTTTVLRGKGCFAFVGMFPQTLILSQNAVKTSNNILFLI
jgi:hypothetical protein